ncbi:MAG: hypothetical protein ACC645_03900 [Pirellulales bacterium]
MWYDGVLGRGLKWLGAAWIGLACSALSAAPIELPVGSNPPALSFPHFPDRVHAFVWRNWQLVDADRLAAVLGTSVENVRRVATSMGLPPAPSVPDELRTRAYITIVRRNWHLLPYVQLLELLGTSAEEFSVSLHDDDFLFIKLGSLKPQCEPLRYVPPDVETQRRAARIRAVVERHFGQQLAEPMQPRFQFVDDLSRLKDGPHTARNAGGLRYVYSYFAPFGDPLLDAESDPYPEGLLARLAEVGVNGIWLHTVLRQLAPGGDHFPEFGVGHQQRQENLRRLVQRARRYGIGVYLYMNEPRAMPADFFQQRPEMAGITAHGLVTMCTSDRRVLDWMTGALSHLFEHVPDLAGVFTITASENPTNCAYSGRQAGCPRCRKRTQAEIVAEVNAAIEAGVHAAAPEARVIAWDWGWNGHGDASDVIAKLPTSVWLMSVSEWAMPIERGGVKTRIGEYSLSAVGPGPRATRHWRLARERGMKTVAKMQLNATWEMAAVPFLPVMDLVAQHCQNLAKESVDGQMLSWTVGGYPSPNLEIAQRFAESPDASIDTVLDGIAVNRYGADAAPDVRHAWSAFSRAFQQFPYNGSVVYNGPHLSGPANLLYAKPTGYRSTMVGIPYDDVPAWCGPYPPKVLAAQFRKVAQQWSAGLEAMRQAVDRVPPGQQAVAKGDLGVAETCALHFASAANQVEFNLTRDALAAENVPPAQRETLVKKLRGILHDEIDAARQLYGLAKADSRIGFEASNHYFYVPIDLVEKVINCESILRSLATND